jgi:hypothetical protein
MPVIPATQDVETGRLQFEVSLGCQKQAGHGDAPVIQATQS